MFNNIYYTQIHIYINIYMYTTILVEAARSKDLITLSLSSKLDEYSLLQLQNSV